MPRNPCLFRETDLRRAIRATRSSGIEIARVEIGQDGRIVVIPGKPVQANNSCGAELNEWDSVE